MVPADESKRPASRPRIVIAGVGLLTPLGGGAWETFGALRAGRTLTDRAAHLPPQVELVRSLGLVAVAQRTATDPSVELAERAAREAATEAGVALPGLPAFLGTSKGAVLRMIDAAAMLQQGPGRRRAADRADAPLALALGAHGYLAHHLAKRTGLRVHSHTVAACASSLVALDRARRFLLHEVDAPDHALVVTAEAALHPLFIHSYRRLGVLAPLTRDGYRARPLDERRNGFVLAEAGAAVLLRRIKPGAAVTRGTIELCTTTAANDPYDLIRPNPAMSAVQHVAQRLIPPRRDTPLVLHPHAPGTPDHDPNELAAIRRVIGDETAPPLYAAKGALGHTLGAAGLVALAVAALSARTHTLPGMPWLAEPIEDAWVRSGANASQRTLADDAAHVVLAAGFGGHAAGACLRRSHGH
jgi:3-oxoacyl-[acyl-carrier-protein] synthase II